ncbi:YozE family protein [Ilumatobacter sp.]|uniref:YozE family protein n=1 Tax=Ilumatobacter sp. TaxID=1967498 RepID=UPI003B52007F
MSPHPFKTWLIDGHAGENSPLGDLAADVGRDDNFPISGGRRALLDYFATVSDSSIQFLDCFEAAWALYEPATVHPFVAWLRRNPARNPVFRDFADEYGGLLPATGDRETMRAVVENREDGDTWNLTCFDVAWQRFRPTCEWPNCVEAADMQMSVCAVHALKELL